MNNLIVFADFVNEGLSQFLYHYTRPFALMKILQENAMRGSELNKSEFPNARTIHFGNATHFISATRNKSPLTGFPLTINNYCLVRIALDGKALATRHKGLSHNFWYDHNPTGQDNVKLGSDYESEEKILVKSEKIDDINRYIRKIDMFFTKPEIKIHGDCIIEITRLCRAKGIPCVIHKDFKDFTRS